MTRYHVEFDIISDQWRQGHNYLGFYIPKDAVITELPDPIKVGDVLTTTEQVAACPRGTVLIDTDGDAWKRHTHGWAMADSLLKGIKPSATYAPYTVAWLPRA